MKEAAGEANMTVITIVLIGLVAAAGALIIPNLLTSSTKSGCCSAAGGKWSGGECKDSNGNVIATAKYWDATNKTCK